MLFLALPPADMLPPAGHRAGPGRAHQGPIARSGPPGGRPCLLRARVRAPPRPRLPHKVAQTPPPAPALPEQPAPRRGPGTGREAGLAPARKVSAGEIPAWNRWGEAARSAPGPQAGPLEGHCPRPSRLRTVAGPRDAPGAPARPRV